MLKDESGKVNVQLVMSKNRVVSTKRVTLPRRERSVSHVQEQSCTDKKSDFAKT